MNVTELHGNLKPLLLWITVRELDGDGGQEVVGRE